MGLWCLFFGIIKCVSAVTTDRKWHTADPWGIFVTGYVGDDNKMPFNVMIIPSQMDLSPNVIML